MAAQKYGFVSPLRYPGGKTRLASFLAQAVDRNFGGNEKVALVEPYAGGAGASLSLLFAGKVNEIVINDLHRAIYTFWKIATSDTDYLIQEIEKVEVSIDEWKKQKKVYGTSEDEYKLAFATLFLNRTNRSGIMDGGPIGGMGQISEWKIDARFNKQTIIGRLRKIKEFRDRIKISNLDGITLLKKLEKASQPESYFIFLDPPYYQKGRSLYLNHYKNKDHEKLSRFLKRSSLKWIMTYDDVPFIKNLYSRSRKNEFSIPHSAFEPKVGKEIMIFSKEVLENTAQASLFATH